MRAEGARTQEEAGDGALAGRTLLNRLSQGLPEWIIRSENGTGGSGLSRPRWTVPPGGPG